MQQTHRRTTLHQKKSLLTKRPELVRETRFSTGSVLAQVMERATELSKELATQASNEAERTALGECLSLGGTGEGGIRADEAALIV